MKPRSVRADAVNIVVWPLTINDGLNDGLSDIFSEVYFEWYCPVCKRHHWAFERGVMELTGLRLFVVLNCSDTTVVFPWDPERKLDDKSIYGQTVESIKKRHNAPDIVGKPVASCWKREALGVN